jgi:hypothetical protein
MQRSLCQPLNNKSNVLESINPQDKKAAVFAAFYFSISWSDSTSASYIQMLRASDLVHFTIFKWGLFDIAFEPTSLPLAAGGGDRESLA